MELRLLRTTIHQRATYSSCAGVNNQDRQVKINVQFSRQSQLSSSTLTLASRSTIKVGNNVDNSTSASQVDESSSTYSSLAEVKNQLRQVRSTNRVQCAVLASKPTINFDESSRHFAFNVQFSRQSQQSNIASTKKEHDQERSKKHRYKKEHEQERSKKHKYEDGARSRTKYEAQEDRFTRNVCGTGP